MLAPMPQVHETKLPGVGVRHEFTTDEGRNMAVIVHHDGRREVLAYDADDPDTCTSLLTLSERDTQTMAEILGVSHVTETVNEIRQEFEGFGIEWVQLDAQSGVVGGPIGDGAFRTQTGVSIVAVVRNAEPVPSPGADFVLAAGDVIVAIGAPQGLDEFRALLGA